jgi:uncharacterized phage protein (TIGR01671 family)
MRDIKFRALNTSTHEWEYGNLLKSEPNTIGEYFINIAHPFAFDPNVRQTACMAGTEGQYTGVKDKKSIAVYEGDIVRMTISKPETGSPFGGNEDSFDGYAQGEVIIHKRYGVCLKDAFIYDIDIDCVAIQKTKVFKTLASYRSEIIGNIHQHPELCSA